MWHDLLGGSLLGLKSFRTLVLRALTDKTQVGTVEADAEGRVTVIHGEHKTVINGNSTTNYCGLRSSPGTPGLFKPGPAAMPLRVADLVCEHLQQLEGIPRFQKQWPLAKRDAGHRRLHSLPEAVRRAVSRKRGIAGDPRHGAGWSAA